MATPCEEEASLSACAACKAEGNTAYANGDLETAREHYAAALEHWEAALRPAPSAHEIGARVRYSRHGFGVVMSAFTMFDEYFLKDLGNDQAIWAGEPGGELKRSPMGLNTYYVAPQVWGKEDGGALGTAVRMKDVAVDHISLRFFGFI
ncbi:unnamed protein product [Durusdinium trenchii]|uniref:Uncharacterized protein n=1 Tax=Durusdinium trenchii TaxID=1381693 RepID=A0ABP0LIC0_9DINO